MSIVKRLSQFVVYLSFLVGQTSFAATIKEVATAVSKDFRQSLTSPRWS